MGLLYFYTMYINAILSSVKRFLVILATLTDIAVFAQSETIGDVVGKLQSTLTAVETASATFEPSIKLVEGATLNYSVKQTDRKGATAVVSSDVNLADVDPYALRQETAKDIIYVVLTAKNKQKLFSGMKNGKPEPYDNELKIYAKDIDQARAIKDLIARGIPIAEKLMEGRLKLKSYDDMQHWLKEHVVSVNDGSKSITQSLSNEPYPGSFRLVQVESDGKSSHQSEFIFNAGDINAPLLSLKVTGSRVGVELTMLDGLKSISVTRDGQPKPYEDNLVIYAPSVDEARDIRTTLGWMSPLAQALIRREMPVTNTTTDALTKMGEWIAAIKSGSDILTQTLTGNCLTTISLVQPSSTASTTTVSTFNWMDINSNLVRLKTKGDKMELELPTLEKKKLVYVSKNGKVVGYQTDLSLLVPHAEAGRRVKYLAEKLIDACKAGFNPSFASDSKSALAWMMGRVSEVKVEDTSVQQALQKVGEDEDKLKFTRTEIKASAATEEIFEFNLSDINPSSISTDVDGKYLTVKFETNFRNKIIKAYKAGKIQPYVYQLEIAMPDVDAARNMVAALSLMVEKHKK